MTRFTIIAALSASALFAQAGVAQQNDVDPATSGSVNPQGTALAALGTLIAGPYDVETSPFDNRCLGVEEMDGYLWVTGAGHTTIGYSYMFHQYSMTGTYIASFPQVSNAAAWGGRDMQAVDNGNGTWTLYAGSDSAEVSQYLWNGTTLTHVSLTTVPGVVGTVRALCKKDGGNFFTKSFTSSMYEFTLAGLVATTSNAALSAYGFGWDEASQSIWSTTTGPAVQEIDTSCVNKAGGFGLTWGTAQGGADVYVDSRNPGFCSMVILGQGTPDSMEVYDLAVVCGGPPVFTLAKTGTCPGSMTLSTTNGTPNTKVAYVYGNAGTKVKPGGVCAGTTVSIANPKKLSIVNGNPAGTTAYTFNAVAALCGQTVQAVLVGAGPCTTSNTITL